MPRKLIFGLWTAAFLALTAMPALAQAVDTDTTNLTVTVAPEAALTVVETTNLTSTGTLFADYTGTTNLTYRIRTSRSGGSGTITARVSTDFAPNGGPSAAQGVLSYACAVSAPGTPCSNNVVASTTADTSVATFGANARSARVGNSGSVNWTLVNDPVYETDNYTAVVTFTITAI
jgi:hypothetical protein